MKNKLAAILLLLTINVLPALAFTDTSLSPSSGNTQPPLNEGAGLQSKAGDLEVENYKARNGITLGGEENTEWPAIGMACNWEGAKCSCRADGSSVSNMGIAISVTCQSGHITGVRVTDLQVSSREFRCSSATSCTVSSRGGGFGATVRGAVTAVTNVVVSVARRVFRPIRRLFRKLF
tara:strand:+ start:2728 stop:3261 length:534 start_codon:yes stop_codon:yes gene_type:complete